MNDTNKNRRFCFFFVPFESFVQFVLRFWFRLVRVRIFRFRSVTTLPRIQSRTSSSVNTKIVTLM